MLHVVCSSFEISEGHSFRFDLPWPDGKKVHCFLLRKGGVVYGYVNLCMHWPVTLDMETGDFWDYDERHIQCKTHGALYELSGLCIAGPCTGDALYVLPVTESEGRVLVDMDRLPAIL